MMTKEQLHHAIDRLNDEQLTKVEAVLHGLKINLNDPRDRWRNIPALAIPDDWPPRYGDFEPVTVGGEAASEQLIRERR
jgi:hypothetical protein